MGTLPKYYKEQVWETFECNANWPPSDKIEPGDYGVMKDNHFVRLGSLKDFNVKLTIAKDPTTTDWDLQRGTAVNFSAAGGATARGAGEASGELVFSKEGAFIFQGERPTTHTLKNLHDALTAAGSSRSWDKDFLAINKVYEFPKAAILISKKKNTKIGFKLASAIANLPLDLLNANISLAFGKAGQSILKFFPANKIRPFFRVSMWKRKNGFPFFGGGKRYGIAQAGMLGFGVQVGSGGGGPGGAPKGECVDFTLDMEADYEKRIQGRKFG